MKATSLVLALLATQLAAHAAALTPVGVERFFVRPGQATVLTWRAGDDALGKALDYTVRDYWGKTAATGKAKAVEGRVEATVKLPRGFFDIEFPATKQRFGIASLPAFEGRADPFFAIDSALSWLVRDDVVRDGLVRVLRRSGVGMSRERLSWEVVNPADGKWAWDANRRYETLRKACQRHGVEVLEMFHSSPRWTGLVGKYPDDLAKTAEAWQTIARRWKPTWGALEVWNEPDIFFGGHLPADQYVPLVQAIARGLHDAGIDTPVVGGVFAHFDRRYLDCAARNGLLDCIQAASFHTYGRALQMEALVERYRGWLRANGRETMPLWITECGRPWKRGVGRPPTDQDAASALDITMKAVEARACGIARHFPFVYPYYDERTNNFGMMGKRATPLRSMAAYARLVAALAHKRYLGDLAVDDAKIARARVFGDDRETVVVLYAPRPDAKASVKLGLPALRIEGIDGRALAVADGRVPLPDGLSYVWVERGKLGTRLRTDTPAMRLWAVAQRTPPTPKSPSPVILRLELDRKTLRPSPDGYRVAMPSPPTLPLTVRAFNLSGQPHELTLKLAFARPGPRVAAPDTRTITVPAKGHAGAAWAVDLGEAFAATDRVAATVTATAKNGPLLATLAFDLTGEADLKQLLKRHGNRVPLPITDLARWTKNIVGDGHMTMTATAEGPWRLTVRFAKGDPWVYPFFALPKGMDLSLASALLIRARCHKPAAVRVFLWEARNVGYLTAAPIIPADGEWHMATVRFADLSLSTANAPDPDGRLDLKRVRRISIGLNSTAPANVLEVSDVYVAAGK